MHGVFLDKKTITHGIDWSPLHDVLTDWSFYDQTAAHDVIPRIEDADIVVTNKVKLDAQTLAAAKSLKLICIAATGVDCVDLRAAKARHITVCNVPAYATTCVVQHTFTLMFTLLTRLMDYHQAVRGGLWCESLHFTLNSFNFNDISTRVLGIVGYGTIGRQVAKIAKAFGMDVIISAHPSKPNAIGTTPFNDMLASVDILSIHCPLNAQTHHLIANDALQRMRPDAIIINTARGDIIDEHALHEALVHGQIAGAGLDVLSQEPPPRDHILLNYTGNNLIITPHIAWASRESQSRLITAISRTITAYVRKQPLIYEVPYDED